MEPVATLPAELLVEPLTLAGEATLAVPGSKSITNRALVLAALTGAPAGCELRGALRSEDTEVMIDCLGRLGFGVEPDWSRATLVVRRPSSGPIIPRDQADLYVANSGTTMRFLTAMVALGKGRYRLDGVPRMRERPIEDLLTALRQLGVHAYSESGNGCPPVVVESNGLAGGIVKIRGELSSQFLSGLMLAAPFAREPLSIEVDGPLVSVPYVQMTWRMLEERNLTRRGEFHTVGTRLSFASADQLHAMTEYAIEPDASAASYFWAAAALTGGTVHVPGLGPSSLQGDVAFVHLLQQMGCRVSLTEEGSLVQGGPLRGIDVDMNAISDTVMTLAAVACFAEGPTTIRNVAHIRHKETDRLEALATELRRLGAGVELFADGLRITPLPLHGARVETYQDHRMAMSLALIGLRIPGVVISNPGCVGKTYPHFFEDLQRLRVQMSGAQ